MIRCSIAPQKHHLFSATLALLALAALLLGPLARQVGADPSARSAPAPPVQAPAQNRLPLAFEPNAGQADESAHFIAHASGAALAFYSDRVLINVKAPVQDRAPTTLAAQPGPDTVTLRFLGAGPAVQVESGTPLPGQVNYLLGSDPQQWRTGLPTYAHITYRQVYVGVDLTYSGAGGTLKGTYLLAPGTDSRSIRWRYEGAERLSLDEQGNLQVVINSALSLTEQAPLAWQEIGGERILVPARYMTSNDGSVGFALGAYDRAYPLTIDPVLTYSTYLGGGAYDQGNAIAVDAAGNVYVTGYTQSDNFPLQNAYQSTRRGGTDAFITKLNAAGSALVFSTYFGGNGGDYGQGIALDSSNNVYVTGYTGSTNFPTTGPIQGTNHGTNDAFVTKLNASGSALVYSTYLGGTDDDRAYGIAADGSGNAYIVGHTPSTDYPTINAFQPASAGNYDVFVSKVNSAGSALVYSTYLGGFSDDTGYGIAADAQGNAYVTGGAYSPNFPIVNAYQPNNASGQDVFLTKINPSGSALVYSTFLGGATNEEGRAIAIDGTGSAYLTGETASPDFPLFNPLQSNITLSEAFVTKFNAAGSALSYSTFLGGAFYEVGYGIAVDGPGNAFITGYTNSADFPVLDAIQPTYAGNEDAFITKLNPAGSAYLFSTYLGGSQFFNSIGRDFGYGIAVDGPGNAYITGSTESLDFPTHNAYQPANGGGYRDAFIAKIANQTSNTATPTRTATPTLTPGGPTLTPTPGCPPNWQVVTSPRERDFNGLADVAGSGPNDVWAVGGYYNFPGPNPNTSLTMHWDGTQWSVIPNTLFGSISAVTVIAANDVWIVGDYANGSDTETFAAHWDGTAWTRFPTPTRPGLSTLTDVDALASDDVWAVGYNLGFHATLVEHWNGAFWAIVPSPPLSFSSDYKLYSVSAVAPADIWAVGYVDNNAGSTTTLIEHWNGTEWTIVPSPNPGNYRPQLYGVAAVSANDVWAVGSYSDDVGATYKPLFLHWDGTQWSPVVGEFVPTFDVLYSVQAAAPHDVWAVGVQADCALCIFSHTFVMHWDGVQWRHVSSPDGFREVSGLSGVAVISPANVWAVGTTSDYTTQQRFSDALTLHQGCPLGPTPTGTPPTATRTPPLTPTRTATACASTNADYTISQSTGATVVPGTTDLGLHCDDCATPISLPFPFALYGQPFNSAIVGSNGTLGFVANSNTWRTACLPSQEFDYAILPFWQDLHLSNQGGGCPNCGIFTSVSGTAPNRIFNVEWRAKDYFYTSDVNVEVRLYENAPTGQFDIVYASVPLGSNDQSTVGVQKGQGFLYTQFKCFPNGGGQLSNGLKLTFTQPPCSSATPTPTPPAPPSPPGTATRTATPQPPTVTRTPGGATATPTGGPPGATPTACPVQFTDVPANSPFYLYIRCLACRGILNGYTTSPPCGAGNTPCFQPGASVTRGQVAKILANAAGLAESVPSTQQTFEDVPPASAFWVYIERLALPGRGYISGYMCGQAPAGPCVAPGHRPYFLPGNNVTRGQLAKIDANAAGLANPISSSQQTFEDVPSSNPFWVYIERLAPLQVISGYTCGQGPAGPCVPPGNRAYFLPGNPVTRGQTAKIVANTFFPNCSP